MQIAVDRTAEMLAYQLGRLEIELEATDQVDVESVEIIEQRFESEPCPLRDAAAQSLAAPFVTEVVQSDAIVWLRYLDRRRVGCRAIQSRHELARRVREI